MGGRSPPGGSEDPRQAVDPPGAPDGPVEAQACLSGRQGHDGGTGGLPACLSAVVRLDLVALAGLLSSGAVRRVVGLLLGQDAGHGHGHWITPEVVPFRDALMVQPRGPLADRSATSLNI